MIVVCSDGTWNDPVSGNATNVLRLARAIQPQDKEGIQQVVFYDWGIGTEQQSLLRGASGLGISKNVQDCYRFIVHNYDPGDELFLFGFSRGAYTVRCLAGMLNNCGILRRTRANDIPDAFREYKRSGVKPSDPEAEAWRDLRSYGPGRGKVDFLGVWDTVGALGIPARALAFAEEQDLFYDPELGSNVKQARHAVSIDERRKDFEPTLWTHRDAAAMKQVWFAGVHGDVGGGYERTEEGLLADIPLQWMAQEAQKSGLALEGHLVASTIGLHRAPQNESYSLFLGAFRGDGTRRISTNDRVHVSVKKRAEETGYMPPTLKTWLANGGNNWRNIED